MNNFLFLTSAAGITVGLAVSALILGLILAMLFTAWESVRFKPIAFLGTCWVTLIRGLPELLVVLFVYFGTLQLINILGDGMESIWVSGKPPYRLIRAFSLQTAVSLTLPPSLAVWLH